MEFERQVKEMEISEHATALTNKSRTYFSTVMDFVEDNLTPKEVNEKNGPATS